MSKANELLALADKKAREYQMERDGREYGIASTQMRALIWALGEMIDQIADQLAGV